MDITMFILKKAPSIKRITVFLLVSGSMSLAISPNISQANLDECMNLTANAVFIPETGTVCIQKIKVSDSSGTQHYKASLKWQGVANSDTFELATVEKDSNTEGDTPSYSINEGILTLPKVDITEAYGTNRYAVELVLRADNSKILFVLNSATSYINPDFISGEAWKPYAELSILEKQAINLLGHSLPYAHIANAVYSFEETFIDGWELIEQISTDSGMQAGLYRHQQTDELLMAFRGTEVCDIQKCSFSKLQESVLDLAADTLLSLGESGAQFRHAVNFAQDIVERYPDSNIKVTGHSLGGGLAQAIGTTFELETFAFNSAPVPQEFFTEHPIDLTDQELNKIIHTISDLLDPVSHADESGKTYLKAAHVSPLIQFDFVDKNIIPVIDLAPLKQLYTLRFDAHGMSNFIENSEELLEVYASGW